MGFADTCNTLRAAFAAAVPGTTVQYPNAPQVTPPSGEVWVILSFAEGESYTAELPARYRNLGIMSAQIMAPEHTGDGAALALADTIATAFRNITISGIRMRVPRIERVGFTESHDWYQISVICPFFSTTT